MYLSHYDLNAYPFQMSTDPKFLWLGEKHKEALATLKYAIFENKGVIALTGDVGTGKTTLINALIEDLGDDIVVTTIYDPGLEMLEFFNIVAVAFSMGVTFTNKGQFLIHFRQFLQKAREQKKKVLLIIDEAQRIGPELLEEVRLLSNLEAEHIRLLNIFFIGQNEFVDILQEDVNRALRQRIAINYEIQPLTVKETESYVKHRLRIAGAKTSIFTQVSIQEIYAFSSGYPRLINIICDHALLSGFVNGVKSIDSDIIRECRKELQISEWSSVQDRRIAEKSMGEEHTQKHNLGPSEDQDDENGSVRLARGLYRQAPVTRPDKKPVVLSILSVVVLFLLAVVVGYYYYHSSQVKVKPLNNISPQKNRAFDSRPSDLKDENQYIVPFIPEAGEKGTSETAEDVKAPSDLKAELAKERSFKEITPNDVQKPVVALSDKRAEDTGINITPDGKWDPWKHSQIQDNNAVRQSEPPNEKNTAPKIVAGSGAANKQEKKQIQREKVVEKEAVKSKKKATKPPVTPKDKASKKKILAKEKKLTAHVDQKAGLKTTPNLGTKTIGKKKLLQESLEPRLKTFLADYSRAYENRNVDQFSAFFAPDAIDDGKPFNQQLPKYRR
ncbi:MAG: AAA family ATPase, partial [Desulfobacterales bacterium]